MRNHQTNGGIVNLRPSVVNLHQFVVYGNLTEIRSKGERSSRTTYLRRTRRGHSSPAGVTCVGKRVREKQTALVKAPVLHVIA